MKRWIRKELLDELLAGYAKPDDLTGPDGLLKALTGARWWSARWRPS